MNADELDRNLDTIRRRLEAMDAAVVDALSDDPTPSELPIASPTQSYAELTAFNDRLRNEKCWTEVDLDAALTPELAAKLDQWRSLQRIPWSTADIAAVGLAGMVGGTCVWFDAAIDRMIRQWLKPLNQTRLIQAFEKAGKQLPIDYMGPGFGGRAHRVKSAGHDLARPFTALRQIMDGQFDGIRWSFGERVTATKAFEPVQSFEEALLRWVMHLIADVLTPMSLPIPGFSLLYESNSQTISKFAHHAYAGIRPGEGLNLRSALVVPPETGNLRDDLIQIGETIARQAKSHATTMRAVLVEASHNPALHAVMQHQFAERKKLITTVLRQAVDRGEIQPEAINDDLWDLLPGYLVFRAVIQNRPATRRTVTALVDDVILPSLLP